MIVDKLNRLGAAAGELLFPNGWTGFGNKRITDRRWPEMQDAMPFVFLIAALGLALNLFPG